MRCAAEGQKNGVSVVFTFLMGAEIYGFIMRVGVARKGSFVEEMFDDAPANAPYDGCSYDAFG